MNDLEGKISVTLESLRRARKDILKRQESFERMKVGVPFDSSYGFDAESEQLKFVNKEDRYDFRSEREKRPDDVGGISLDYEKDTKDSRVVEHSNSKLADTDMDRYFNDPEYRRKVSKSKTKIRKKPRNYRLAGISATLGLLLAAGVIVADVPGKISRYVSRAPMHVEGYINAILGTTEHYPVSLETIADTSNATGAFYIENGKARLYNLDTRKLMRSTDVSGLDNLRGIYDMNKANTSFERQAGGDVLKFSTDNGVARIVAEWTDEEKNFLMENLGDYKMVFAGPRIEEGY